MPQDVWIGRIFLKDEGGYEIILRALEHYVRRLKSIDRSPELRNTPMFVQIVQQEAAKTCPRVEQLMEKIKNALQNPQLLDRIQEDIPLIEKALECYMSDIQKHQNNTDEFYANVLSGNKFALIDLQNISTALEKLKQFC